MSKKQKPSVNEYNQITLANGTVISVHGLNQRIKDFGYTLDPVSEAAPDLLEACKQCNIALDAFQNDDASALNVEVVDELLGMLERAIAKATVQ